MNVFTTAEWVTFRRTGRVLEYVHFEIGVPTKDGNQSDCDDLEVDDLTDDEDPYGINDKLSKYKGIGRNNSDRNYAKVRDIKLDKPFIVLVADAGSTDAFYVEGSDTPLWLAQALAIRTCEETDARTIEVQWWAPEMRKLLPGERYNVKDRFRKIKKDGRDQLGGLDHTQLVCINFTLNGLNPSKFKKSGKLAENKAGKLPALCIKKIEKVLRPSEAEKVKSICPGCSKIGGDTVVCRDCNQAYHNECLAGSRESDDFHFLCPDCS